MQETEVLFKRLHPDAVIPQYMTQGAAGLDLTTVYEETPLSPGHFRLFATGLAVRIPAGHEGQIRPRSGLAWRDGVTVLNAPGTIDADYCGEVSVLLINHGPLKVWIKKGQRIAQLVIAPVARVRAVERDFICDTGRGTGGFGSTG